MSPKSNGESVNDFLKGFLEKCLKKFPGESSRDSSQSFVWSSRICLVVFLVFLSENTPGISRNFWKNTWNDILELYVKRIPRGIPRISSNKNLWKELLEQSPGGSPWDIFRTNSWKRHQKKLLKYFPGVTFRGISRRKALRDSQTCILENPGGTSRK